MTDVSSSSSSSSPPRHCPSDEELTSTIRKLIHNVNLEKTGVNAFIKLLAREFDGVDAETLKPRKKFIRDALTEAINEQDEDDDDASDDDEEEEEESEDDDDDDDDEGPPSRAPTSKKKGGGGGGLSAKKEISPELAKFLGATDGSDRGKKPVEMARTEIVKSMWEYIREHNLQNPSNKKEILLDSKMKEVFGCDMFTMFTMNKYISAHVSPFTPVDLTPASGSRDGKGRAAAKRKRSSKGGKGSPKRSKKGGGGGNNNFKNQPPYRLSPALSVVVKADVLPRPQVVKKLWEYIREHNLQNPGNRKEILCDDKFKKIMGGRSKVTMFSMNSFVGDHIIEKADPSEYTRPADDE